MTGWPASRLMQDDCRPLHRWLANTPHARAHAKEAADEIQLKRESEMNTNTTGADRMREDFESWFKKGAQFTLKRDSNGDYAIHATRMQWNGWQAAKQTPINPEPRKTLLTEGAIEAGVATFRKTSVEASTATLVTAIFHAMEAQLPNFVPAPTFMAAMSGEQIAEFEKAWGTSTVAQPAYVAEQQAKNAAARNEAARNNSPWAATSPTAPAAQTQEAGWQPIKTIPKNGPLVLCWSWRGCAIFRPDDFAYPGASGLDGYTYWMPLPKPPATLQADPTDKSA